ncbi:MAG: 2OG-Fe(II) oxygenase [Gammaproteobacteria bacterium]|nr:2OG-Fe(II) oxygenase [Gammaproteobacteria bacterium]
MAAALAAEEKLFARIAEDLLANSWSVLPACLPTALSTALQQQLHSMGTIDFSPAGIGRGTDHAVVAQVRRDEILWIEGATAAEREWLDWSGRLQSYLNRRLFLGLFSFESHFAHYGPGAFYRKHLDAFKAQSNLDAAGGDGTNRVVSLVAYFNSQWQPEDGGELVLYAADGNMEVGRVTPALGTLVVFLSEDIPHEVLPAQRDRFSIAGWYRINQTRHGRTDPPR